MSILISGYSYFPPEIGKTDIYEYGLNTSKKYFVHVLCNKRRGENKTIRINKNLLVSRKNFFSERESLLSGIVYLYYLIRFIILKRNELKIFHLINPTNISFFILFFVKISNYLKITNITTIYDIRTGPLRNGIKLIINRFLINLSCKISDIQIILFLPLKNKLVLRNKFIEVPIGYSSQKNKVNKLNLNSYGFNKKDIIFVYTGSTYYRRRIDLLIESFIIANKENKFLKLLIVGKLEEYLEKYQEIDFIKFTNKVPYLNVKDYLSLSNAGLAWVPKIDYFDYQPPLKTLEYLGNGLPTLGTNTIGNREIISKVNGIIEKDNPSDFAKGILKLSKALNSYNKKEIKKSVAKYQWEEIVGSKLIPLYKKILLNKKTENEN